jgi:Flp pilus assembly protein CpaB
LVAVATTVAAALLLVIAVSGSNSGTVTAQPETVLVASTLIQKGTSGSVISGQRMFRSERLGATQVPAGAIADASAIQGKVAARDIQRGQALNASAFTAGGGIASQLAPNQRAISIPLDTSHGLAGVLHAGDRVDVYAGFSNGASGSAALKLLLSNVQVLAVNGGNGGGFGGTGVASEANVVLKVLADRAGALAFASDNGKVWLDLRGANATGPDARAARSTVTSLSLGGGS